jgi:hypothetical protein
MADVALDLTLDISFLSPTLRLALFPSQSKGSNGPNRAGETGVSFKRSLPAAMKGPAMRYQPE